MATRRPRASAEPADTVPQVPQTSPMYGAGMPSHDFTLQAVMELQKSVGELNANLASMKSSLDSVKSKVDDLVGWKNKVLGGAAMLLLVGSVLGWSVSKLSDYVTLKSPTTTQQQPSQGVAPPQLPPAPAK